MRIALLTPYRRGLGQGNYERPNKKEGFAHMISIIKKEWLKDKYFLIDIIFALLITCLIFLFIW